MNKFERAKDEKDGLDVYDALMRATRDGYKTLDANDMLRLKWYGLYQHNTKAEHFMLRVKVTQGILTAKQTEVLADITDEFGRGIIDATTRQCVQIHWIELQHVPEIFERLKSVGLTTSGACGDITRNIVGCTLAGIGHNELVDGYATAQAIHEYFLDNRLYSNLPRKYKISVTGCQEDCARGLINCLALSGAIAQDGTAGFNIRVGGGLSSAPRFARSIDVFVTPDEAPEVVGAITAIFRDSDENRKKRGRARIKFLVDSLGVDGFREELVQRVGRELRRSAASAPDLHGHDHIGASEQNDGKHSTVGLCIPVGRLKGRQLRELARLANTYGTKAEVRLTHQQNVLIPWIPNERVADFLNEEITKELTPQPTFFTRGLQTCTGKEFCGLAKVYTKDRAREIATFLDTHIHSDQRYGEDFRLHFAGCSSSCAQQQIADVGIEGVLKRVDGEMIEAMDIRIGGHLGPKPQFGEPTIKKVPHYALNETLLSIFTLYEQHRAERETFRVFAKRTQPEWWQEKIEVLTSQNAE